METVIKFIIWQLSIMAYAYLTGYFLGLLK